ncbi:cytochrome P450 [Amycolatopsis sp. NPDC059027]|uniref:cytochrome P450 n=1 Tax=unclassified Amycolatopsis TaxID=2618356 RepID=UPI00366DEDB4
MVTPGEPGDPAIPIPDEQVRPVWASVGDTLRVAAEIAAPTVAIGVVKRRPAMMALAHRTHVDRPAIRLMRKLRHKYGAGPLRLRVPGRSLSLVLDPAQVGGLLADAPVPFSPDTTEKNAALRHFQPHGVLISEGGRREERRELNEAVLEPGLPLHHLAGPWAKIIHEEGGRITEGMAELGADRFTRHWWTIVRRITLGGDTAVDREITALLDDLRLDANWAYARRQQESTRDRFLALVRHQVALDRPGSLAGELAKFAETSDAETDPAGQLPHWMFAFDAAGIVTLRALALLATHPAQRERALGELEGLDLTEPHQLPYLRSCVLESVRLWPTTPALLRESRSETAWGPGGTSFLVYTPFFHRDDETLPYADDFAPDIWLDGRAQRNPALVPFSGGPGICPGRDVVLFTASTLLAVLLKEAEYTPEGTAAALVPGRLPSTLDHFGIRLGIGSR